MPGSWYSTQGKLLIASEIMGLGYLSEADNKLLDKIKSAYKLHINQNNMPEYFNTDNYRKPIAPISNTKTESKNEAKKAIYEAGNYIRDLNELHLKNVAELISATIHCICKNQKTVDEKLHTHEERFLTPFNLFCEEFKLFLIDVAGRKDIQEILAELTKHYHYLQAVEKLVECRSPQRLGFYEIRKNLDNLINSIKIEYQKQPILKKIDSIIIAVSSLVNHVNNYRKYLIDPILNSNYGLILFPEKINGKPISFEETVIQQLKKIEKASSILSKYFSELNIDQVNRCITEAQKVLDDVSINLKIYNVRINFIYDLVIRKSEKMTESDNYLLMLIENNNESYFQKILYVINDLLKHWLELNTNFSDLKLKIVSLTCPLETLENKEINSLTNIKRILPALVQDENEEPVSKKRKISLKSNLSKSFSDSMKFFIKGAGVNPPECNPINNVKFCILDNEEKLKNNRKN